MENKAMNRTNVIYESPYTGQEETEILQHAESLKDQTRASDGNMADTVQVYDTDGVPHTISKTELISKAGVNLPSLDQIGGFVAYDKEGNALGLMSTEQVAEVVGERIEQKGLYPFMYRRQILPQEDLDNIVISGIWKIYEGCKNSPSGIDYGILNVEVADGYIKQTICDVNKGIPTIYSRTRDSFYTWRDWVKVSN